MCVCVTKKNEIDVDVNRIHYIQKHASRHRLERVQFSITDHKLYGHGSGASKSASMPQGGIC